MPGKVDQQAIALTGLELLGYGLTKEGFEVLQRGFAIKQAVEGVVVALEQGCDRAGVANGGSQVGNAVVLVLANL